MMLGGLLGVLLVEDRTVPQLDQLSTNNQVCTSFSYLQELAASVGFGQQTCNKKLWVHFFITQWIQHSNTYSL